MYAAAAEKSSERSFSASTQTLNQLTARFRTATGWITQPIRSGSSTCERRQRKGCWAYLHRMGICSVPPPSHRHPSRQYHHATVVGENGFQALRNHPRLAGWYAEVCLRAVCAMRRCRRTMRSLCVHGIGISMTKSSTTMTALLYLGAGSPSASSCPKTGKCMCSERPEGMRT